MAGLSAVLAVALGLAGVALLEPEAPLPVTRFVIPPPEGESIGGICCASGVALSPDGEWLAFTGVGGGPIYRRRRGQIDAEAVPGTEGGTMPFFSWDTRWLGFYSDGRLRKVPMTGGPAAPIAEIPQPGGMGWGDNDLIVFADNADGSLYTVPGGGGVPTPVPPPSDGAQYQGPWMLPGGEAALVRVRGPTADEVRIAVVDLTTGVSDTLGFGTTVAYGSGHLVFSGADGTLQAQPFDPESRLATGPFVAILDGIGTSGPGAGQFGVSAQGGLAYQRGSADAGQALMISGPSGAVPVQLPERGDLEYPAFSRPDGRRIAMEFANVGGRGDLWIWDRDQESLRIFTVEGVLNVGPVWTPDGARIAFGSGRGTEPLQIYWQAADGSGTAERLLETDFLTVPHSWSPDGRTLALVGQPNGNSDIGLLTVGDSAATWIVATEFNENQPQISPDGAWLASTSDRSGQLEVYVEPMSGPGGLTTVSNAGGHSPRWAPAGGILYYARGTANSGTIVAATFTTEGGFRIVSREERFPISDLNATAGVNYDVSPDGEEFVYIDAGGGVGRDLVWILNWPEIVREMTSAR
jgi:Tol biopolymer transport system component